MEFLPLNALSTDQHTVLSSLYRNGELVITNEGQPAFYMLDLSELDLSEVTGYFQRKREEKTLAQRQLEALKRLVEDNRGDDVELFDEEFDAFLANRLNITRELDI